MSVIFLTSSKFVDNNRSKIPDFKFVDNFAKDFGEHMEPKQRKPINIEQMDPKQKLPINMEQIPTQPSKKIGKKLMLDILNDTLESTVNNNIISTFKMSKDPIEITQKLIKIFQR